MILEAMILEIKTAQEAAFERDFASASRIFTGAPGCLSHQLHRCIEQKGRYLFVARWESVEAHTERFRKSPEYQELRALLYPHYASTPIVLHYEPL